MIRTMDHFTIVTDRLEETRSFYAALGLVDGPRPDFGVDGAWLYAGDRPVLHVVAVDRLPEPRRGVLDHMAFAAEGLCDAIATLRDRGAPYRLLRTPRPFSRWQVFAQDPNGAEVELDFDIGETPPDDWKTMAAAR
ncbi:VOC family protein [Sphingomonas sp. A2-49]|uniref:VOC family protein n=1 Tax=Sphingomonas sp. A2-49 TaxID=1391375 RepID=UPI0021D25F14|nr:VOC family protein [Sphingomonas sp. A2-49]MCU6453124.1 VOC family protein [Sphingomonas sp. A2-49]